MEPGIDYHAVRRQPTSASSLELLKAETHLTFRAPARVQETTGFGPHRSGDRHFP